MTRKKYIIYRWLVKLAYEHNACDRAIKYFTARPRTLRDLLNYPTGSWPDWFVMNFGNQQEYDDWFYYKLKNDRARRYEILTGIYDRLVEKHRKICRGTRSGAAPTEA
jgi:hypothetical protein